MVKATVLLATALAAGRAVGQAPAGHVIGQGSMVPTYSRQPADAGAWQ